MTQNSDNTPQFKRIQEMQSILSDLEEVIKSFEENLDEFESKQHSLQKLMEYYGSETWFDDIQSYDEDKLPAGYDYSVLGEDPVYDVFTDNHKLAIRLLEVATKIFKS